MTNATEATPAPAPEPGPQGPSGPRLGWRAERRPAPGFAHVLGAVAGVLALVSTVAFVVSTAGDDPQLPGVGFTLLLVVIAKLAGFKAPGPIRSACTAALVLGVPVLWFFAVVGNGSLGTGEVRLVLLLSTASYLALYLLSWTKGRAIFLAGTLVGLASWIAFEVSSGSSGLIPLQDRIAESTGSSLNLGSSGSSTSAAVVTLLLGLAFLAAGAALDRRQLAGAATPFVAVGAYETIAGAVSLGAQESVIIGGLLAIAAGAVVGLVATRGENRRGSTWFGAIAVFGGIVAIIADIAPDSAAGVGGISLAFTVVLGVAAWQLAPVLGEPDDGNPEDGPRPAPTPENSSGASSAS